VMIATLPRLFSLKAPSRERRRCNRAPGRNPVLNALFIEGLPVHRREYCEPETPLLDSRLNSWPQLSSQMLNKQTYLLTRRLRGPGGSEAALER
jgi:hypothetical protein